ncbi:MAG: hypothetical protein AB1630_10855, partial [bacterium]
VINQFSINPNEVMPGNSTIISGRLEWDKGGWFNDPIPNASVGIYIQGSYVATKTTNIEGKFSHSYSVPQNSPRGGLLVKAIFPGNTIYKPCNVSGTLLVSLISNLTATPLSFNPYGENAKLEISYLLHTEAKITIEILDANGKLVKTLINLADRPAGNQTEVWYGVIDKSEINPYDILIAPPGSYKIKVIAKPNNGLGADSKEIDNVEVK